MVILFTSAEIVQPATFADGLFPAPIARCKPFSLTDAAYEAGRTAAIESFGENPLHDVLPPDTYSAAECWAFSQGAEAGFREADYELEQARIATAMSEADLDDFYADLMSREGHGGFLGHDA